MSYSIKADKLGPQNKKSLMQSAIYITSEKKAKNSGLGYLFIVAEIKSKEKNVPAILEQTINELKEYYYHSPTKNAEAALETTSQYFNENICDIARKDIKWVREKFNIALAAVQEDKLVMSGLNNIQLWLFRAGKMHNINEAKEESKKKKSKKILSHIISGQLENGDAIMMTNTTLFDYFSYDKIKQTVLQLGPSQCCAFFKNTLADNKTAVDFNTIVIKFDKTKKQAVDTTVSSNNVLSREEDQDKLKQAEKNKMIAIIAGKSKQTAGKIWTGLSQAVKQRANKTKNALWRRDKKNEQAKQETETELDRTDKDKNKMPSELLNQSPLAKHRLKIAIGIIAIIFAGSLFWVNNKKDIEKENMEMQTVINTINEKINASEAALIYKDENKARDLLAEANSLLMNLPQQTDEQKYNYQELKDEVEAKINKIYNIKTDNTATQVVGLEVAQNPTADIIQIKNNLYTAKGSAIYKINPADGSETEMARVENTIDKIISFNDNLALLYAKDGGQIYLFDPNNNSTRKINIELPNAESKMVDWGTYGTRMYMLDSYDSQIYKFSYNKSSASLGSGVKWLEQEIDLSENTSISVDGNIWLGAANSEITKLFKGKKEIFKLSGLLEPISTETKINTSEQMNYLYIIDNNNKKIIIATKQGEVKSQITTENIGPVVSLTPNEGENLIYIMTDENIYQMEI